MGFLYQQFPTEGYPITVFLLAVVFGIALVIVRPFWAFLFSVIGLAGKNYHAAVLTRMPITGEYLNLNDLFLWIAVLALFVKAYRANGKIQIPNILMVFIVVLLIGSMQSLIKYGPDAFVLRSIWSVAIFPIMFLISANFIKTEDEARLFFWAFFLGALIASLQHMVFLGSAYISGVNVGAQLRTISYITSGGIYLLAIALFTRLREKNIAYALLFYSGITLLTISFLMNQTRQLYVVFLASIMVLLLILRNKVDVKNAVLRFGIVLFGVVLIFGALFSDWDVNDILGTRLEFARDKDTFEESYYTRMLGMQTEVNLWLNSTMIFGVGAAYPPEYEDVSRERNTDQVYQIGALNHVAITSYLAHFGAVGALVFLIIIPLMTIKRARDNIEPNITSYVSKICLLAMAVALMDMLNLFGSMLNTAPTCHMAAAIYGAFWGLHIHKASIRPWRFRKEAKS
jgi:hypothetical protein